jgi:hypothetical protein
VRVTTTTLGRTDCGMVCRGRRTAAAASPRMPVPAMENMTTAMAAATPRRPAGRKGLNAAKPGLAWVGSTFPRARPATTRKTASAPTLRLDMAASTWS